MAETKTKQPDTLRIPKPKKTLGLSVPPSLKLPHEDLIIAPTLPSQTSQSSQTRQTPPNAADLIEAKSAAPVRDFMKVANSIHREAIPQGVFAGKSKHLYDCLYAMTRGAVMPAKSIRISKAKLMKKSGIGSRVTFEANIERLVSAGLLEVRVVAGEHKGNEFEIYLPGEKTLPSQTRN